MQPCVALTVLKFSRQTRLVLNSETGIPASTVLGLKVWAATARPALCFLREDLTV